MKVIIEDLETGKKVEFHMLFTQHPKGKVSQKCIDSSVKKVLTSCKRVAASKIEI